MMFIPVRVGIILRKPYHLSNTSPILIILTLTPPWWKSDCADLVDEGGDHPEETLPATNKQQQEEQFQEEDRQVIIKMTIIVMIILNDGDH